MKVLLNVNMQEIRISIDEIVEQLDATELLLLKFKAEKKINEVAKKMAPRDFQRYKNDLVTYYGNI